MIFENYFTLFFVFDPSTLFPCSPTRLSNACKPAPSPIVNTRAGEIPGFHLQITPTGTRTFYLQHTAHGRRRFFRLGAYPLLGLSAARSMAREYLAVLETGGDPQRQDTPAQTGTLNDLLDAWLGAQRERGRRRLDDVERAIRGNCAALLDRPAAGITANDLRVALAAIHQRGSRVMANRVRTHLHALWVFGMRHDHDPRYLSRPVRFGIETNPVVAIPRDPDADRVGERSLDWGEVREVWTTDKLTVPARQAVRILLCTGSRVNEIVQAHWGEFDLDAGRWTLPAERSKNHRTLLTPLTPLAVELLVELRDIFGDTRWLFPGRNVHWAKQPWGSTALGHAIRNAGYSWTARDLRRTWKTLAGGAGLTLETRNRIQGHALQDVGSRHYDRHDYLEEKRTALLQWERELRARLAGDNVRALRAV